MNPTFGDQVRVVAQVLRRWCDSGKLRGFHGDRSALPTYPGVTDLNRIGRMRDELEIVAAGPGADDPDWNPRDAVDLVRTPFTEGFPDVLPPDPYGIVIGQTQRFAGRVDYWLSTGGVWHPSEGVSVVTVALLTDGAAVLVDALQADLLAPTPSEAAR